MKSADGRWEYDTLNREGAVIRLTGGSDRAETLVIPAEVDGKRVEAIGGFRAHRCAARNVIVSDGVEEICREAFDHSEIESLRLPDSMKVIRVHAFFGCERLKTIEWGRGLCRIAREAFRYCRSLERLVCRRR